MVSSEPQNASTGLPAPGPSSPALERAEAAFARGDHAALRKALAELDGAAAEATRARRDALARAISVDPVRVAVLVACLLGLVAVCFHYLSR